MKRFSLILACVALGCGGANNTPPAPGNDPPPPERLPQPGEVTMQDINLYLHDTSPTPGGAQKPSFWVNARRFTMEDQGRWLFEDARAVIYGKNEGDEGIILEAKRGTFEEGTGAIMEGGVVATAGDMTLRLDHIVWKNPVGAEQGVAYSDAPLSISAPDQSLNAESVRLFPAEKTFELTRVAGSIYVGRLSQ